MSTRAAAKTKATAAKRPAAKKQPARSSAAKKPQAAAKHSKLAPDHKRTIAISGSQSGLGLAIRKRLEAGGARVIGIDLPGKGAEVEADLSKAEGRQAAVQGVLDRCKGRLDGVVANAGVDAKDARLTFDVNFHGVVDLLEGLRPALAAAAPSAAVVRRPSLPPTSRSSRRCGKTSSSGPASRPTDIGADGRLGRPTGPHEGAQTPCTNFPSRPRRLQVLDLQGEIPA